MEEVFRNGTLEMSASPVSGLAGETAWGDLLTNRILAVAAIVLLVLSLLDFFRLIPHLAYSFDRSRGAAELEHSVGIARTRNGFALILALPFCLLADRYALLRPAFWSRIPALWSAPAALGVLLLFLLVRSLCYAAFRPRRLGSEESATLKHQPYNHFILLTLLMLASAAAMTLFRAPDPLIRSVLRWETAVIFFFAIFRSGQFLDSQGLGFTTILYLCGLEILPAALLVAVVLFF